MMRIDKTIELLQTVNQQLQDNLEKERAQNQILLAKIDGLQHQLDKLLRLLYGKKSERNVSDKDKASGENKADQHKEGSTAKTPSSKQQNGRNRLPDYLERKVTTYDINDSDKQCDVCGNQRKCFGKDVSEQLEFIPAKLYVLQHVRLKYVCPCCHGNIIAAPMPSNPIHKGLAGPHLLAEVIVSKYCDHLPLHRQEQRWKRLGMELPRSTLCDWVSQCAGLFEPLVNAMKEDMLLLQSLHTDDTPVPVQAKNKTHKGRLWVYVSGRNQRFMCTIYDYTVSRSQQGPQTFLKNYKGYLHADAYAGYDKLYETGEIIELACFAHARRNFYDITQAVEGPSLADEALEFIGKLYAIEDYIRSMTTIERYYYRKRHTKPILKKFKSWLSRHQRGKKILPKSPIGQAISYSLNHWRALNNFLGFGDASVDNNTAERAIKPLVIGRKNWLFAGSHQGAKNTAILYSLIETCKQNNINPSTYLADVLQRLPTQLMKNIRELLPYHWQYSKI